MLQNLSMLFTWESIKKYGKSIRRRILHYTRAKLQAERLFLHGLPELRLYRHDHNYSTTGEEEEISRILDDIDRDLESKRLKDAYCA